MQCDEYKVQCPWGILIIRARAGDASHYSILSSNNSIIFQISMGNLPTQLTLPFSRWQEMDIFCQRVEKVFVRALKAISRVCVRQSGLLC